MAGNVNSGRDSAEKILDRLSEGEGYPRIGFAVLLLLYFAFSVFVVSTSRSEDLISLFGMQIPVRSLTGAFSSAGNLCIVLLTALYKKPGFIFSLVILLVQFPILVFNLLVAHSPTSIAGFFMNVLTIATVVLLYFYNVRMNKYQVKLRDQAVTDGLTGLPNQFANKTFITELGKRGELFCVAVLRLRKLKSIKSVMGQETVNALIVEIAKRFNRIVDARLSETNDFVAYLGDGEFSIVMRKYKSCDDVEWSLLRYEDALMERVTIDGCDFYPMAYIGYAEYPTDVDDCETLPICARLAAAEAKHIVDDHRICRFTSEMMDAERAIETERKIRAALENGALYYVLQSQYDMEHKLSGFEALARIADEDGSVIEPSCFIPIAEKVGIVDRVDFTVFKKSAEFFGKLLQKTNADITLSVNVSVKYLMKNSFIDEVKEILETSGVPAGRVEVEITESVMIDSAEKALQRIDELKRMGLMIAIDDFGTGYSSLSYLNSFPADKLKIDKAFIEKMNTSEIARQYVAVIISIGHVMNLKVISEGVEEPEQLETLSSIGCDYIQGFVWGRPMSPQDAEKLVIESA